MPNNFLEWVWNGRPLFFTDHARQEMEYYNLDPFLILGMLESSYKCNPQSGKGVGIEYCSIHRITYMIKVIDDYSINSRCQCWTVKHIKPAPKNCIRRT